MIHLPTTTRRAANRPVSPPQRPASRVMTRRRRPRSPAPPARPTAHPPRLWPSQSLVRLCPSTSRSRLCPFHLAQQREWAQRRPHPQLPSRAACAQAPTSLHQLPRRRPSAQRPCRFPSRPSRLVRHTTVMEAGVRLVCPRPGSFISLQCAFISRRGRCNSGTSGVYSLALRQPCLQPLVFLIIFLRLQSCVQSIVLFLLPVPRVLSFSPSPPLYHKLAFRVSFHRSRRLDSSIVRRHYTRNRSHILAVFATQLHDLALFTQLNLSHHLTLPRESYSPAHVLAGHCQSPLRIRVVIDPCFAPVPIRRLQLVALHRFPSPRPVVSARRKIRGASADSSRVLCMRFISVVPRAIRFGWLPALTLAP
ncbi:hypothetical protein BKA62DRAFT_43448 [Auriculariales sp. MPI-PUGE-AT-0066]|nr:hypothetical protein BKA62DRAFT_43448 [Auriculariales sp. MPI-PUGE-AT-0066]